MAPRGTLYQFLPAQKLKEFGYDELPEFLKAAKSGNSEAFPGGTPELSDFAENIRHEFVNADTAIFPAGYEFEWCELLDHPITHLEGFADWVRKAGGEAYILYGVLMFKLSSTVKMRMLKPAYERFMRVAKDLSLEQFATTSLWELRDALSSTYREAALVNECFCPIEQAIRELPENEWIVSARPILMH